MLHPKGAVAYREEPVSSEVPDDLVATARPYASLSGWKLVTVVDESNRHALLHAMRRAYERLGHDSWAAAMERWKAAPVRLVFMMPASLDSFGGVPPGAMRPQATIEVGMAVQSLSLLASGLGAPGGGAGHRLLNDLSQASHGSTAFRNLADSRLLAFRRESLLPHAPPPDGS